MIHVEKRTYWTFKGASLASALGLVASSFVASSLLAACASSRPVTHVVEVPIDQYQPPPAPPPETPVEPPPVQAVETPAEPAEPNTGGHPTEIKGGSGSDRITTGECSKVFDRYAILKAVEGGMSMSAATHALPLLRGKTHLDPAMQGFTRKCLEKYNKEQIQCSVRATTLSAWKTCKE